MKVVTVNIPKLYVKSMEMLIGDRKLYPSRSELIRAAVREYLLDMLNNRVKLAKVKKENKENKDIVKVPVEDREDNGGEPVTEFKTYKIVKKLDHT